MEAQCTITRKTAPLLRDRRAQVANDTGMGGRINTIMQTCFFAISGILPREEAIEQIKKSIKKSYSKRGEAVVQRNYQAVDATLQNLHEVKVPVEVKVAAGVDGHENGYDGEHNGAGRYMSMKHAPVMLPMLTRRPPVPAEAPAFVRDVLRPDDRG